MSRLYTLRQKLNLTQEELAEKSGISVRTIQRVEAGLQPKGYTRKALAKALNTNEQELLDKDEISMAMLRLINLSSLLFVVVPPVNIIAPVILMITKKQFNPETKQVVTLQIMWTVLSALIFMVLVSVKKALTLGGNVMLFSMILLISSDVFMILRNAAGISKNNKLSIRLKFSLL